MLADDRAHGFIGKALFVIAEQGWCVDSRQNRRLPRGALRSPFDAEAGIGRREPSVMRQLRVFALEDGERRGHLA
jgi:hypothetical protein